MPAVLTGYDHVRGLVRARPNLVQAVRPILIFDEPQNMESELRVRALPVLNPLFALWYSAAHRNPYNGGVPPHALGPDRQTGNDSPKQARWRPAPLGARPWPSTADHEQAGAQFVPNRVGLARGDWSRLSPRPLRSHGVRLGHEAGDKPVYLRSVLPEGIVPRSIEDVELGVLDDGRDDVQQVHPQLDGG